MLIQNLFNDEKLKKLFFISSFIICLTPWVNSSLALLLGLMTALSFGNPFSNHSKKLTKRFLAIAIVGMGFGVNLSAVTKAGMDGFFFTICGLSITMLLGWLIGRALKTPPATSLLINVGTAICGGSAIAAVSSALSSDDDDTSVSLGVVFILNACALILFPIIGHWLNLSQDQFGLWSALAIHDTSSVVGATMQYGARALEVGTTVKLLRALWIVPLTFIIAKIYFRSGRTLTEKKPVQHPWFILGFVLASAFVTYWPQWQPLGHQVEWLARRLLVITLFLIGTNLSRATLKKVGLKPLVHAVVLWLLVACGNLIAVRYLGN